ncbi:MAG: hypothetical protein HY840_07125 [Bacteroidetes bacterium]|nr:hypothetical protein [Bacteroidota bacterium]
MNLRWFITALFLLFQLCLFSQVGSVRVVVLGGGSIDFIFNSIAKYKTGITYTNYSTVGITVNDNANPAYTWWELRVNADDANGDGVMNGTDPANSIPFSTIEMSTSIGAGCASCLEFFPGPPNLVLTNAEQVLVDGNQFLGADDIPPALAYTTDWISITYYCGTTVSLLGRAADYYSDDIVLTIYMGP